MVKILHEGQLPITVPLVLQYSLHCDRPILLVSQPGTKDGTKGASIKELFTVQIELHSVLDIFRIDAISAHFEQLQFVLVDKIEVILSRSVLLSVWLWQFYKGGKKFDFGGLAE